MPWRRAKQTAGGKAALVQSRHPVKRDDPSPLFSSFSFITLLDAQPAKLSPSRGGGSVFIVDARANTRTRGEAPLWHSSARSKLLFSHPRVIVVLDLHLKQVLILKGSDLLGGT